MNLEKCYSLNEILFVKQVFVQTNIRFTNNICSQKYLLIGNLIYKYCKQILVRQYSFNEYLSLPN